MDIGRAITYVFQDKGWLKKVLIGGVLMLIPIIGWAILGGYWIRLVRNIYDGQETPLPEWDDFGADLVRGFKVWAVALVWTSPAWILNLLDRGGTFSILGILASLLSFAIGFISPLYMSRFAISEDFSAAFDFNAILAEINPNLGPLFLILVAGIGLGIGAMAGLVLCFIGVIFTIFLVAVMQAHLYGQLRRKVDGRVPLAIEGRL